MTIPAALYRFWAYWCGVSGTRLVYAVPHYAVVIRLGSTRVFELVGCRPAEGASP